MDGPYRSAETEAKVVDAPADQGIVGDIIGQFADSYAFLRELVQNAIDAGTPTVEVRVDAMENGNARVAVIDRGEGMTRDIIENQLLVLFRSTKETDHGKIGKFGIGFASVLSPNPVLVVVKTVRDGRKLELQLQRDLTYQLFEAGRSDQPGTTVELELVLLEHREPEPRTFDGPWSGGPITYDGPPTFDELADQARDALVRWCRHAAVPIELVAGGRARERIDRPLALEHCPIAVRGEADDGQLVAIVGVPRDMPAPQTEFFNHGLALYRSTDGIVGDGLHVVIQDSRLGHTLTRDNVRRDDAYRHAIEFAASLVPQLRAKAAADIAAAAQAGDHGTHAKLVDDCAIAELQPRPVMFPLVAGGCADLAAVETVWATQSTDTDFVGLAARELAAPVFACPNGAAAFGHRVRAILGKPVKIVEDELTRIVVERTPDDATVAILALAAEILGRVKRKLPLVAARFAGANADALSLIAHTDGRELESARDAQDNPFARLRKPTLAINVTHATILRATRAKDLRAAAGLVTRAILLRYAELSVATSEKILEDALAHMGVRT